MPLEFQCQCNQGINVAQGAYIREDDPQFLLPRGKARNYEVKAQIPADAELHDAFATRGCMTENGVVAAFGEKAARAMQIALIIVALVVIAGSIWADYKWRKWMADRRRDRE